MFRIPLRAVVAATAAVLAGSALTACQPVRVGSAATIGDQRITTAQLDSIVADWREEFAGNPDAGQLQQQLQQQRQIPFDPDSPARSALYQLIGIHLWDEVARQNGITITRGQIDQDLARGGDRLVNAQLLAMDLPTRFKRDVARSGLIAAAIAQREGAGADLQNLTPQQQQALSDRFSTLSGNAARSLNIKVNPRYGSFDPARGTLLPVRFRLSTPGSGTR